MTRSIALRVLLVQEDRNQGTVFIPGGGVAIRLPLFFRLCALRCPLGFLTGIGLHQAHEGG